VEGDGSELVARSIEVTPMDRGDDIALIFEADTSFDVVARSCLGLLRNNEDLIIGSEFPDKSRARPLVGEVVESTYVSVTKPGAPQPPPNPPLLLLLLRNLDDGRSSPVVLPTRVNETAPGRTLTNDGPDLENVS
jgi:hypothetical protein